MVCIKQTYIFLIALICMVAGLIASNPLHASCQINWTIGVNCKTVGVKIVKQIGNWTSDDNCKNGGERCLYKLKSSSSSKIEATHETPVKHYVDDLTFDLTNDGGNCNVKGYSTSETWYAVLDSGTNYCNLHNLITGAGLDQTPGYKEITSNYDCTQYSSANCDKY